MRATALIAALALIASAEVRKHPKGEVIPHDKYVRVVSQADSPLQQAYIKTKDGLYVAAAIRKPKGDGLFPALVYFHGAPGAGAVHEGRSEPLLTSTLDALDVTLAFLKKHMR